MGRRFCPHHNARGSPMIRSATLGLCLLLAGPAMAQSLGEKTGVNSVVGITPSTQDFVTEAAQSDMFEIQASQAALGSTNAKVKAFAAKMIADHNKTTAELKTMVGAGGVNVQLPNGMSSSQQSMLTTLHGLHDTAFDSQYESDQVSGHKDAVSLFQRYGKDGDNAKLKAWAASTLPTLQQHLDIAQNLDK
jgi:putative membrane protein